MATQTNDICQLKRKKRKRKFIKKLIIILCIFLCILIGYLTRNKWLPAFDGIVYKVSNSISKEDYKKNFPLRISSSSRNEIATFSDRIVLLSDTNVYIYQRDGKLLRSFQHSMTEPVMRTMSDRVMIYDHSGNKVIVEGRSERMFSKDTDAKILFASMSSKGDVAVVSESDTAASDLTVYNSKGNKIVTSNFKQKIVNVAFWGDSSNCILSTLFASGGDIVTRQYCISISNGKELWSSDNTLALPMLSSVNNKNEVSIIADECYFVLSDKGTQKFSYVYHGELMGYATDSGVSAVMLNNVNQRTSEMLVFNSTDNKKEIIMTGEYKKVKVISQKVYLLTKNSINIYSAQGELMSSTQLDRIYDDFTVVDDYLYLLGGNEISILSLKTK